MRSPTVSGPPRVPAPRPRESLPIRRRIAASARAEGLFTETEDIPRWLDERRRSREFSVRRIPFHALDAWSFAPGTGDLVHRSGRFFTMTGLHVTELAEPYGDGPARDWHQPIIEQPEVGILGILAKEFNGVLHFLMQAKMEPGNPNLVQLSPTVQATRSNYTRAHQGSAVRYIEHFVAPAPERVIVDVLQSEHGAWFLHKSNRNMVVEATGEVALLPDYRWLTLRQIHDLLRLDNVVNMDARTVLSCLPDAETDQAALMPDVELLSWFTGERTRHQVRARRTGLGDLPGWRRDPYAIRHEQGRYFSVVAVAVHAANREVAGWTQPLIEPVAPGIAAFYTRAFAGVRHVLVHARAEGGFLDTVELAPTVQGTPVNYAHLDPADRPLFLGHAATVADSAIRYQVTHSEEGGRFLNAESRYLIVDADGLPEVPVEPPDGYAWVTPGQLAALSRHGHYLNVQARTLLACLRSLQA
ncbi:NDP-hexose 2,3-dehydratase family protein [Micromonospora sp. RTGN7]|uniref:NDP-hexose 2,3-dehydratase family protein n=1 Tax=Micromonospora sp. RTGN7 TaxID=3016526 RepID=UPI0029FF3732|nr:NDP-hexose 2,3-dehydratase family protein [Micromonospora sp. RTGN7]